MGSSCPRVGTLGGTTAGAPLWDPIALWTLASVTVVYHIVTMVYDIVTMVQPKVTPDTCINQCAVIK